MSTNKLKTTSTMVVEDTYVDKNDFKTEKSDKVNSQSMD